MIATLLPEGRLKKRLRAAWRWRQMTGLLSLLWPFFQRFDLAETPEGNFPERPMPSRQGERLKDWVRGTKIHAGPTWVRSRSTSSSSDVTSLFYSRPFPWQKNQHPVSHSLQAPHSVEGEAGGRPHS